MWVRIVDVKIEDEYGIQPWEEDPKIGHVVVDEWEGPAQSDGWPDTRYRVGAYINGKAYGRAKTFRGESAWSSAERLVNDLGHKLTMELGGAYWGYVAI